MIGTAYVLFAARRATNLLRFGRVSQDSSRRGNGRPAGTRGLWGRGGRAAQRVRGTGATGAGQPGAEHDGAAGANKLNAVVWRARVAYGLCAYYVLQGCSASAVRAERERDACMFVGRGKVHNPGIVPPFHHRRTLLWWRRSSRPRSQMQPVHEKVIRSQLLQQHCGDSRPGSYI
mgnify:CR=1 FL=1